MSDGANNDYNNNYLTPTPQYGAEPLLKNPAGEGADSRNDSL